MPDSAHARPTSTSMYSGTLVPSHTRIRRAASRRSSGRLSTTVAAATPADAIAMRAIVLDVAVVIDDQLRRVPPVEPEPPLLPKLDPVEPVL